MNRGRSLESWRLTRKPMSFDMIHRVRRYMLDSAPSEVVAYICPRNVSPGRLYARWRVARSTAHLHRCSGRGQLLGGRTPAKACPVGREPDLGESGRTARRETLRSQRSL